MGTTKKQTPQQVNFEREFTELVDKINEVAPPLVFSFSIERLSGKMSVAASYSEDQVRDLNIILDAFEVLSKNIRNQLVEVVKKQTEAQFEVPDKE